MKKFIQKAIQLKSWVSESVKNDDGKISFVKSFFFFASWYGAQPFAALLLEKLVDVLNILNFAIPHIIHFIEGLISALSYFFNKRGFFYAV